MVIEKSMDMQGELIAVTWLNKNSNGAVVALSMLE